MGMFPPFPAMTGQGLGRSIIGTLTGALGHGLKSADLNVSALKEEPGICARRGRAASTGAYLIRIRHFNQPGKRMGEHEGSRNKRYVWPVGSSYLLI